MSAAIEEGAPGRGAPGTVLRWVLAARPKTLSAAAAPVLVGSALAAAEHGFRWDALLSTFLGAGFIQIGTNFANDYFDAKKGADGPDRLGPARATASGWVEPRTMKTAMIVAFGLAVLAGVHLVWLRGWPMVVIGLASVASGVGYTAGRRALAYIGAAEIFVLAFFGVIACAGTHFAHTGQVSGVAAWVGAELGAIAAGILAVNNLRDREQDARVAKRTLAVRFGATFARAEYSLFIAFAFLGTAAVASVSGKLGWLWPLLALPLGAANLRSVWRDDGRALNGLLGRTAGLEVLFAILCAVGALS
ncbi:MAG: 1,4-dihydroxy-2-naphthoate polyprenyltransferase [Myxococcota bacterium]